jgi:AcrR family transcriptional regulator
MTDANTVAQSETAERILDAAERLFMEHGYQGTSMRMVTGAAQVNLAAVNYHFGSKECLMQAVFKRRLAWLNAERLRLLDEMEAKAAGAPLRPSQIVEAFFSTLLAMGEDDSRGGMTFLRLIGRTLTEPAAFIQIFFAEEYGQVVERYKQALYRSLPDVPPDEIAWRFQFMLGAMSYAIAGTDALRVLGGMEVPVGPTASASQAHQLRARLLPFLLGGLRAPLPDFGPERGERINSIDQTLSETRQFKKKAG